MKAAIINIEELDKLIDYAKKKSETITQSDQYWGGRVDAVMAVRNLCTDASQIVEALREAKADLLHEDSSSQMRAYEKIDAALSLLENKTEGKWSDKKLIPVIATTDDSGHWYVIPADLKDDFANDLSDEDMCDSGQFDNKYGQYRTGGHLNLVQLYAKI